MGLGALFSGGKDSVFATYSCIRAGLEVSCIITLQSVNLDSWMFHTQNIWLVDLQAESMGIPAVKGRTSGKKGYEQRDLKKVLEMARKEHGIGAVASGAIASRYQYERIKTSAGRLGLKLVAPLWHRDPVEMFEEMLSAGFDIRFSSVSALGLNVDMLGKRIDREMLKRLVELNRRYGLHISGEGGEYESLVLDCPLFQSRIVVRESENVIENEHTGRWVVKRAVLEKKRFK